MVCVSLMFVGVFVFTYLATGAGKGKFSSPPDTSTAETVAASSQAFAATDMQPDPGTTFTTTTSAKFTFCHTGGGGNCVVDGDTAWIDGEKVRIADIDAPETHPPRCPSEADLGKKATDRLAELMNSGPFEQLMADRDRDRYGRKLRILVRNGKSLGMQMVSEGLARQWEGRRQPWC
ncbi:putative nuclease [Novosphingobium resinovorum]|uniref:Putative nuclease n=1 Tax=Novosphingobium resinovorum TaxID=158500 RepID=A0A031JHL7_9SPHN|nr:putative nuclease [Novosphingobium resinovorum]